MKYLTKSELKTGDILVFDDGHVETVIKDLNMTITATSNWNDLTIFDENLNTLLSIICPNIVKIIRPLYDTSKIIGRSYFAPARWTKQKLEHVFQNCEEIVYEPAYLKPPYTFMAENGDKYTYDNKIELMEHIENDIDNKRSFTVIC